MNNSDSAKDFSKQGLELTTDNASFAWNFAANASPSEQKKVTCDQFNPAKLI